MRVASVIVDIPTRALDHPFDYLVPPQLEGVSIGCAVSVEFGARPAVAYVIALESEGSQAKSVDAGQERLVGLAEELREDTKLKPLLGILSEPYFDACAVKLAFWIAAEYLCTLPEALHLFLPPGGAPKLKRIDGAWTLVHPGARAVDDRWAFATEAAASYEPPKRAFKQQAVMQALSCGGMRVAELSLELGNVNAALKTLEGKGIVRIERKRRIRSAMESVAARTSAKDKTLTPGQQNALDAIAVAGASSSADSQPKVVLMDGITGSGKTEVYLRAIAAALEQGKSACVLVPEIALTPQTVGRFRSRFDGLVAVLHSRLSVGERFDQWDIARSGDARVVIGTRSALFAPLPDLGLIIIDEEHESSYKQDSAPRYDARDTALELARLRGAALVLGSATPRMASLIACEQGGFKRASWTRVELPERPSGQALPQVTVVDMGGEFEAGHKSMFSRPLSDALLSARERGEKSVLLLNKRGFASFVLCRECGYVPECPDCSVSLTYHEVGNRLVCHHCDYHVDTPNRCPKCGSPFLRKFGAGTQRVEDELRALLPPDTPIIRMDADTTKGKGAHERLLEQFAQSDGAVLLGTQMIAKGLDFPEVTLVGVINADTTLNMPDYRAPERTYQLLEQVSGRAGRDQKPGRVIVQTYAPQHPAILAAASHDRSIFLEGEREGRCALGYPPYRRLANIIIWGKSAEGVQTTATRFSLGLNSALATAGEDWVVLGPAPCMLERLKGETRWHILIKAGPQASFADVLAPLLAKVQRAPGVKVTVDVDPDNLF